MGHAWCRDVARDERVRAAEDGRDRPLPTLKECIKGPFADAAERSSTVSKKGEGQSGLRTERVTLEITHNLSASLGAVAGWDWETIVGSQMPARDANVYVRVVSDEEREEFPSSCPIAGGTVVVNGEDMVTLSEFLRHTTKLTQEAGVAKRERDELRKSWLRSEESGTRLLAERNAALDAADGLRKQVAELKDKSHATWVSMNKYLCELAETRCERDEAKARVAELEQSIMLCSGSCGFAGRSTQVASGGEQEPVAWMVLRAGFTQIFQDEKAANVSATDHRGTVVPLYRAPPQPRGWLSEEEREMIGIAHNYFEGKHLQQLADACEAILARSTPPEVVLESWREAAGDVVSLDDVRAALAAIGVEVKEVGRV